MSKTLPTHAQRVEYRARINGTPYPDNPNGWYYDNDGNLVPPNTMPNKITDRSPQKKPCSAHP